MSYILDALRRADSERERGSVPSIHSPPAPQVVDDPKPAGGNAKALVWVIVGLLLALAGLLAWHLFSGKDAARIAADNAASEVPSASVQPMPSPSSEPPRPTVQAQAPVQQPMAPPPAMPVARPPAPAQFQPSPSQFQRQQAPVLSVPERVKPAPAAVASTTQVTPPEGDNRVYATSDLPANIQRELPKLVVGGAMYSDTPANRMLIINSQVFHEGDKLTPELVLQEIKLKSAVFKYKGYRYGVSY